MNKLYENELYQEDVAEAIRNTVSFKILKDKKVVVTGAAGLIGSFIVDMFLLANEKENFNIEIYALGRSLKRLNDRFSGKKSRLLHFIQQDVSKPIENNYEVDYIIHAASNAYPSAFTTDPVGTVMANVTGTYNLLEFGKNNKASRMIFISSGEVYGQVDNSVEEFEEPISGYVNPVDVRSCYPNSKRLAETLCVSYYKQFGLETIMARPCHTFGPNVTAFDNRASVQFINDVIAGRDIILKSKGSQLRSYCYISDTAAALLTILINGNPGEAYNIAASNSKITIAEFAKIVGQKGGQQLRLEIADKTYSKEQSPITKQVLNSEKLESLGWQGKFSVEKGIEHTIEIIRHCSKN